MFPQKTTEPSPHPLKTTPPPQPLQTVPDYLRDLRLQLAGQITLGTGFGAALVGITLIEIDSWGDIGRAGFITACAGTAVMITGMFLLGFSRPVHLWKIPKPKPGVEANPY